MAKNKFIDQRFMSNGKTSPLSNKLNLKKYIQSVVDESGITPTTNTSTGKYRLSQFPETVLPKTEWVESYAGEAVDEGVDNLRSVAYIFKLDDGTLVYLSYCQSVLKNGVHIYECYELEGLFPYPYIGGYWVAFKQNEENPELFEKVGELKMTIQFWDNWYNWTAKDDGDNTVKFISSPYLGRNTDSLEVYTTKLTWTSSNGLTAQDTSFNYGGNTALSLYNSLYGTNYDPMTDDIDTGFDYRGAEYTLDDDYYGLAMGDEAGWNYYRFPLLSSPNDWKFVGFNILTGQTKKVDPVTSIPSITNFNSPDPARSIGSWSNHPKGLLFTLFNNAEVDNGNNFNGVTALWSPLWTNNTTCIYLIERNSRFTRENTSGDIRSWWYWDNNCIYTINNQNFPLQREQMLSLFKYNIDSREVTLYQVPFLQKVSLESETIPSSFPSFANDNSLMFVLDNTAFNSLSPQWSLPIYYCVKTDDDVLYSLHLDFTYPTHALGDKLYNINTMITYNLYSLGTAISKYNIQF
jgi:hypothetical protein